MRIAGALSALSLVALAACGQSAQQPAKGGAEAIATPAAVEVEKGRFEPRNDCIELPGAKPFFVQLENAVSQRDANMLLSITSADVKLDFGGGGGLTTFRERLSDKSGQLWQALDAATTMGCAHADNGDLVMPWYAAQPMDDIDTAKAMIVTGKDVPVLAAAATDARALAKVSWDAVTLADGFDVGADFQHVVTAEGEEGYIASDKLRSPLGYRLRAAQVGNGWQIVSFVRGD